MVYAPTSVESCYSLTLLQHHNDNPVEASVSLTCNSRDGRTANQTSSISVLVIRLEYMRSYVCRTRSFESCFLIPGRFKLSIRGREPVRFLCFALSLPALVLAFLSLSIRSLTTEISSSEGDIEVRAACVSNKGSVTPSFSSS